MPSINHRSDALLRWTFIIAAICGVAGILVTYFFVPDMTGVDLADEDAAFMKYLADSGWEGKVGEDDEQTVVTDAKLGYNARDSEDDVGSGKA
jgi:hypothetical protein